MNDLRDLGNVLASTIALDQEIEDASRALCHELAADYDSMGLDALLAAVLDENDGRIPDIDHDHTVMALSELIAERNAQTCQVHMDECDTDIASALDYLSSLHGVPLTVHPL